MGISWQRNLYALTLATLLMFIAFGFIFPFLPLYIGTLGVGNLHDVELWAGGIGFGQALVLSIFSPIWGVMADRHGRRMMVLRVAFLGGIDIGLMGLCQNVGQLLILRLIQGALTGVIAAATPLATSFVPKERLGYAMGLLQMSLFAGNAIGPLIGGFSADHVGYRWSFAVSAVLMLAAGVITLTMVKEDFHPPATSDTRGLRGMLADLKDAGSDREMVVMMIVLFSVQFGANVVYPILPLFIEQIAIGQDAATLTGIVLTVAGIVSSFSAVFLGPLGDKAGYRKVLIILALAAGLCYIPQAFVTTVLQLAILRGVLGLFDGGIIPAANSLILSSPHGKRQAAGHGTTYGLVYMASGMGFALGPLAGGVISATAGLRDVFLLTAFVLLAVGISLPFGLKARTAVAA